MSAGNWAIIVGVVLTSSASVAADLARGQSLHDKHCFACHDTAFYTRPDPRIQSLSALRLQVPRCAEAAQVTWSANQLADVVHYLNATFYHFPDHQDPGAGRR